MTCTSKLPTSSQVLEIYGTGFTVWGNPAGYDHDPFRCGCRFGFPEAPFLTNPTTRITALTLPKGMAFNPSVANGLAALMPQRSAR